MGTSSSNYGPKRNTPLLPDWNDNDTKNGNQEGVNDPTSSNGENANHAIHGKIVAGQFANFLNNILKDGIDKTYENLGIGKISGDSVEHVFNNLAEILSSGGGTE